MGLPAWLRALWSRGSKGASGQADEGPGGVLPFHVAIIMDGNGRWARRHGLPVGAGHRAGVQAVRRVITAARDAGIGQLTLYSFSTENWGRPTEEVEGLMRLHAEMIESEVPELHENDCRVAFVGSRQGLSADLLSKIQWAESLTAANTRMILFIAFNYGGRQEVVEAVRRAAASGVDPVCITEDDIGRHLYSPLMRDPDLCIRTSGERRMSNFLLWQSAYSELHFSDRLWPDFDEVEFRRALADYAKRDRRFGARRSGDLDA